MTGTVNIEKFCLLYNLATVHSNLAKEAAQKATDEVSLMHARQAILIMQLLSIVINVKSWFLACTVLLGTEEEL